MAIAAKRLQTDEQGQLVIDYNDSSTYALGAYGYGRWPGDEERHWWLHVPARGFGWGRICEHEVVEHEDGTITVSPSLLVTGNHGLQWHGYLVRGEWRLC